MPVIVGALVTLLIQLCLVFLGSALGLVSFHLERGELPKGGTLVLVALYGLLVIAASCFAGGYVAGLLSQGRRKSESMLHALAGCAAATLVVVGFASSTAASTFSSYLTNAGVGIGTASSFDQMLDELRKLNPRIESEVHLKQKRVISRIQIDRPRANMAAGSAAKLRKEGETLQGSGELPKLEGAFRGEIQSARRIGAAVGFASFAAILLEMLAAAIGGRAGWRRRLTEERSAA